MAKLTPEIVEEVKKMASGGATQRAVGDAFGISQSHVCNIMRGKYWLDGQPSYRTVWGRAARAAAAT